MAQTQLVACGCVRRRRECVFVWSVECECGVGQWMARGGGEVVDGGEMVVGAGSK